MAKRRKDRSPLETQQNKDSIKSGFGLQLLSKLGESCLRNAEIALAAGDGEAAMQWMEQVSEEQRPKTLLAAIYYQTAKNAGLKADWRSFENQLVSAVEKHAAPLYQQRLALSRTKQPTQSDDKWRTLCASVDPAIRLTTDALEPLVVGVWSCGAYFSRERLPEQARRLPISPHQL